MDSLVGKKLLVLGANVETIPLIQTAKKLGVYVYVTDFNPNAPAKKYADKSFDVDGLNIHGLVELCETEKIDGVIVGVADRLIHSYFELSSILNLPCYASKEQCEYFTNKSKFNELCYKFDINTIPNFNNEFLDIKSRKSIEYPVFVKPTDANSGKGISICYNEKELIDGIIKAESFSKTQSYLIEKFMQSDDMFVNYTFIDGKIFVSATADRFTTSQQGNFSRVCIGATYPSKHTDLYFDQLHDKMLLMFKSLDIKNGVFMISAFVENKKIYLYDPGFRLQGEAPDIPIKEISGFDQKQFLVNFSLNEFFESNQYFFINKNLTYNKYAITVWILLRKGKISKIQGLEILNEINCVVKYIIRFNIGDMISKEMIGTESQVFARIYLVSDDKNILNKKASLIQDSIKVYDENNLEMSLRKYI
jgi:biotin carboxylase